MTFRDLQALQALHSAATHVYTSHNCFVVSGLRISVFNSPPVFKLVVVLSKSDLENRDYGRRGYAALSM
jgi:hypothetical protein